MSRSFLHRFPSGIMPAASAIWTSPIVFILLTLLLSGVRCIAQPLESPASAPAWMWAVSAGGRDIASGDAVCVDRNGDVYVGMETTDTVLIGGTILRSRGSFLSSIVRYRNGSPNNPEVLASIGATRGPRGS